MGRRLSYPLRRLLRSAYRVGKSSRLEFEAQQERGVVHVGRHTYGRPSVFEFTGSPATLTIGSFCSIGHEVLVLLGGEHQPAWASTFPFRVKWNLPGAYED